jgi:TPR repeat protein
MRRARPPRWVDYARLLVAAAALGEPDAQENLAAWHLEGLHAGGRVVIRRSPKKAVLLLEASSRAGNPVAQNLLGYCFDQGIGVKPDVKRAASLYRKAFGGGNAMGAANLATLYRSRSDLKGELRWLKRAFELNDWDAGLEFCRAILRSPSRRGLAESRRMLKFIEKRGNAEERRESRKLLAQVERAISGGG